MALSASIRISKQAGVFSISPSLNLRGVVNESSPAFALLKNLERLYDETHSIRKLEKQTSSLTRSVLRLLKEGAVSPYEVDKKGRTLLHYASSCANSRYAVDEVPAFRELIRALLDAGVAVNEVDLAGETAFNYLLSHIRYCKPWDSGGSSVCEFLANKGAEMSDVLLPSQLSLEMQNVAMLEPWQDVTQCSPLSVAVLRKSEQDVIRILRAKPSSIHELNRRKQNPLHLAFCWPRGIQLLLDAEANYLLHQTDVCHWLPIDYSTAFRCFDAIQMLLNAGSVFHKWVQVLVTPRCEDTIRSFFLSALQERRRKLFELAKLTLPAGVWADLDVPTDRLLDDRAAEVQQVLVDADIEIPKSISVLHWPGTIYHDYTFTVKQADQLWNAGFRDIDSLDGFDCTPIMYSPTLEYYQWLLQHGADPHQEMNYVHYECQPVAGLTVLHRIAHLFGLDILDSLRRELHPAPRVADEPSRIFEEMLVESQSHDDCHCACSSSGCTPSTILLKMVDQEARFHTCPSMESSDVRRKLVQRLESPGHPASSAPMRSKIVEKVIRFETFEALQLSHTCCVFEESDGRDRLPRRATRRRYTPAEVQDIHEEWEELLSKHEDLVSEFCDKFQELGGTLTSFLEGYWQTRMGEVFEEEKPLDGEVLRKMREIGVVLEEVSEEVSGESEEDFLDGDLSDEDLTDEDYDEGSNEEEEEENDQDL